VLIAATRASKDEFRGLTGKDRAMLYTVAANTGLRASELASLTPESFDLDAATPTVRCLAGYTKNGEEAVLPLRADVVVTMREYLSGRTAGLPIWPGSWARSRAGGAMMKADLNNAHEAWIKAGKSDEEKEARREDLSFLQYLDASGRHADFHSLRHTFISNLARSGVHPKVAQTLARHSTIDLTMNVYTHTVIGDLAEAVERLPALAVEKEEADALADTGTDGRSEDASKRRTNWRNFAGSKGEKVSSRGGSCHNRPFDGAGARLAGNPLKSSVLATTDASCREMTGAGGGGRTLTRGEPHGILNPARLPIPPLRRPCLADRHSNTRSAACQRRRGARAARPTSPRAPSPTMGPGIGCPRS